MMSPVRSRGSPPAGTSSRVDVLESVSRSRDERLQAGEGNRSVVGVRQAVKAKRVKARNRSPMDDNADSSRSAASSGSSSGNSMTKRSKSAVAGAKKSSHSHARLNGNTQMSIQKDTESEGNHINARAAMQKPSRGVVYLGHIPSGFSEPQMFRFFSQFGQVVGVELRRSKKTGQSKGYGYVGFELPEVAEVVAETMNNYMMFGRTLSCQVVTPARVPRKLFKNWGKKFRRPSTRVRAVQQHNKHDDALPTLRQVKRRLEKQRIVAKRLKALGLEDAVPMAIGAALDHNIEQGAGASEEDTRTSDGAKLLRRKLNTRYGVVTSEGNAAKTGKNAAKGGRQKSLARGAQPGRVVNAKQI